VKALLPYEDVAHQQTPNGETSLDLAWWHDYSEILTLNEWPPEVSAKFFIKKHDVDNLKRVCDEHPEWKPDKDTLKRVLKTHSSDIATVLLDACMNSGLTVYAKSQNRKVKATVNLVAQDEITTVMCRPVMTKKERKRDELAEANIKKDASQSSSLLPRRDTERSSSAAASGLGLVDLELREQALQDLFVKEPATMRNHCFFEATCEINPTHSQNGLPVGAVDEPDTDSDRDSHIDAESAERRRQARSRRRRWRLTPSGRLSVTGLAWLRHSLFLLYAGFSLRWCWSRTEQEKKEGSSGNRSRGLLPQHAWPL